MDIQPTTQITLTITMTGDEARQVLVDPSKFQDDLRETLREHNGHSANGGKSITLGRKNGGGKSVKIPKAHAAAGASGKERCPKCGESFQRLKKHLPHCQAIAGAAE